MKKMFNLNRIKKVMKNLIVLITLIIVFFSSCAKDDDNQTFFVNVYSQYSQDDKAEIASPTLVYLFKDNGKEIDKDKSYNSVFSSSEITYTDGSTDKYTFKSNSETGINTFENIPNNKYVIFVMYLSYNRLKYGASHKHITVNHDYRGTTEKKIFLFRGILAGNYGYQDWNEKW